MAFGSKDTKGIYKFGEDDLKTTFSELLNTGMDSVSDAARSFSGTAAQRAAFLDAAPGSIWQDTNGTKQLWRWLDGSWNLINVSIAEGGTGATTAAGARTNLGVSAPGDAGVPFRVSAGVVTTSATATVTVTLPASRFSVSPLVTAQTVDNANVSVTYVNPPPTTTSFGIRAYTISGGQIASIVHWHAIQMTTGSAAG